MWFMNVCISLSFCITCFIFFVVICSICLIVVAEILNPMIENIALSAISVISA